jgi:YD repeat-containing protein
VTGWVYDEAGNVLDDGRHTDQYDGENRLIRVDGGATARYAYDAFGARVSKSAGGRTAFRRDTRGESMMRLQGVCRWLTFGWFAWFGCFGLAQEPNAPVSVCDVITNIKKYRNKVQLVEGDLVITRHGAVLFQAGGGENCPGIKDHRRSWPARLDVTGTRDSFVRRERVPTFRTPDGWVKQLELLGARERRVRIVLLGEIRSRRGIRIVVDEDGDRFGNGYGQMGRLGVQLVVKELKHAEAIP